jgi:hypothetical protein
VTMFRLVGTSVFLGVVLAALALAASAAVVPPDAPDYDWAQPGCSASHELTEPAGPVVLKVTLPADAPDYDWAQPGCSPSHELTQPAGRVVATRITLPADAPDYNWAQREPSTAPYEPTEPATQH